MHPREALIVLLILLGSAGGAQARKRPRVMVLDLPGDTGFKPSVIKVVNSFVAKDLRDSGFEVITPTDITAALGVERQKQLMGCTESSCLAEIGGAMGADYILHGELASMTHDTALTLTLTDSKGVAINEVGDVVAGQEAESLLKAVNVDVPKLIAPLRDAGKLSDATSSASTAPSSGAPTTAVASSPAPGESHLPSYLVGGAGVALLIGSGIAGGLASSDSSSLKSATTGYQAGVTPGNVVSLRNRTTTEAWASTGMLAAGVAAVAVGAALWIWGGSSSAPAAVASLRTSGSPALAWDF